MKIYLLQHTDASSSISTDDEFIDDIEIASLDESVIDEYILDKNIELGRTHMYSHNYQYYTKKCIELV